MVRLKAKFFAYYYLHFFIFQFLMVRLFMQIYKTFLEKPNFLDTILYVFLLIFINVLHKLLKYNKLTYMIL